MDAVRIQDSARLCHLFGFRAARDIPDRTVLAYVFWRLEALQEADKWGFDGVIDHDAQRQALETAKAILTGLFGSGKK